MELNPDFCLATRLARFHCVRPADPERVFAGLVKAGLPPSA